MNHRKQIVIITGSSGFIGSSVARRLSKNYLVIGLDKTIPETKVGDVEYFAVDITSKNEIDKIIEGLVQRFGSHVSSVIHLAAYYNFDGKESHLYQDITVNGTKHLIDSLNTYTKTQQFIFSSTMLVHEPSVDKLISESDPVRPGWAYPKSKVEAEKIIHDHRGEISALYLRIAGVYEDNSHSIPISNHISRIYECQFSSALFPGNADHGQSWLHREDLVDAIELAVEKRSVLPEETTILLGEEKVLPYRRLQELIGELTHDIRWPAIRVPKFFAKAGAHLLGILPFIRDPFIKPWMIQYAEDNYVLNLNKAKTLLGWTPKKSLEKTLPLIISDLKKDPYHWYKANKLPYPPLRSIKYSPDSEKRLYWAAAILNIFLGFWLISNPFTLGKMNSFEFYNDLITGFIVVLVSLVSLLPPLRNIRWVNALLGTWLMFAPLAFWTESPAMYSSDTLIGGLILLFAGFTPSSTDNKSEVPAGWSYNPSSWIQRLPIMTLAFLGFLLARYLAAFQLGHISEVWDPFFGNGSEKILQSEVSKAFPVSDGGLGAMSYLMDVIAAAIGDRNRWRTMPWMVILFGVFILPTGVTSITLVMLQPISVGAWCTICLVTAFIMLVMVPPAVDEVVATVQFLRRSVRSGRPFWKTFLSGGDDVAGYEYVRPEISRGSKINVTFSSMIGVWLLFLPYMFGFTGSFATNAYIVGALVITFSVIAFADVARLVRVFNIPLGAWLCISPWFIGNVGADVGFFVSLAGMALILLSIQRGKVVQHFGSFDPWVHFNISQLAEWFTQKRHLQNKGFE